MSAPGPLPPPGTLPPIPDNIESIIGPQLLGSLFNFTLYGILALQVYIYHTSFPQDNRKIKWLVYFVFAFETAQTIMNGVDVFNSFARGFGNLLIIAEPGISPIYTPIMGSVIAFMVQIFFSYRIWIIKRSVWWLSATIATISLVQAASGFVGGVRAILLVKDIQAGHAHNQTLLVYMWLIGDAVADVLIAGVMSVLLLKAKSRQHSQTNDAVSRIVRMTIETNALSTAIAVISLVLFATDEKGTFFICPTMVLGKIYSNTLLLTFNNRNALSRRMGSSGSSGLPSYRTPVSRPAVPFCAGLNPEESFEDTTTFATEISIIKQSSTMTDSDAVTRLDEGGYGGMKVQTSTWH
ncbi:hypothetical protein CPB85DRAFT_1437809 [Mucidula mucida]|nr:hypothetical protein CPB85DRAFT_1437809 [Mucidula mucida]